MKKNLFKIGTFLYFTSLSSITLGEEVFADQRYFYIGAEAGIVEPVKKNFRHKNTNTKLTLKKSQMYSGKLGYSFYPQMALEFSATYQPKYKLGYTLPKTDFTPISSGTTNVISDIYMINLIYDLKDIGGFTPFVIGGGGLAIIKAKAVSSYFMGVEFFRLKKTTSNCPAWQVGLGVSKEITTNFFIDVTAKLQVVHNIKINYDKFDPTQGKFSPTSSIKKTIGVGEFGLGFTYKLPL